MEYEIAIIGAGAAGLAAAIFAAEAAEGTQPRPAIVLLDGARRPGAKILVSGGGRCNVTNRLVRPEDFWGGPRPMIRSVLRAFDHRRAREWFESLGVPLKVEGTGKIFPVSNEARSILNALLDRAQALGVALRAGVRVTRLTPQSGGFQLECEGEESIAARRVILATGGMALPKSGSDGAGLVMAHELGHTIIPVTPALCPLVLPAEGVAGALRELSGITIEARLGLIDEAGRRLFETADSLLLTHFGLSGPAAMNLSRHLLRARLEEPGAHFLLTLGHPALPAPEAADRWLQERVKAHPHMTLGLALGALWPERLARMLAGAQAGTVLGRLTRPARLALARDLAGLRVEVEGGRGWSFAETTAGGVDLREVDPRTMASRRQAGLFLCGEVLDVDGRIGGFNFQWAWASGYLAGRGAAAS